MLSEIAEALGSEINKEADGIKRIFIVLENISYCLQRSGFQKKSTIKEPSLMSGIKGCKKN